MHRVQETTIRTRELKETDYILSSLGVRDVSGNDYKKIVNHRVSPTLSW